ncbi:hypothetical protein [Mesorhizobium sp. L-8-3]|uniref:hypothetical protein n=1 Tax=Mesorhizobium sp. L-8-3 TaxID=2744522 RepID=UPI0019297C7A|nr:hypothetical protein [Mesorhizobium sp. L-8-3]BCH22082.1 hypothetical protein MesoLjLb_18670 [Mesorhizobium sp. L-8-3]
MVEVATIPATLTLMGLWLRHKSECRPVGAIVADARAGAIAGIEPLPSGFGFAVIDEAAALASMRKIGGRNVEPV